MLIWRNGPYCTLASLHGVSHCCPLSSEVCPILPFFFLFFSFCPLTLSYHHRIGEVEAWHHHRNWCRACEVHACRSADVLHWCGGPQRPHLCRKTGLVHGTAPVATQVTWWLPLCRNTTWHLDLVSAQKSPSQCNKGKKKEKDTQTSHSLVLSPAAELVHPCGVEHVCSNDDGFQGKVFSKNLLPS